MASRFLLVVTLGLGLVAPFAACGSDTEGDGNSSSPGATGTGGGSTSSSSSSSSSASSSSASTGGGGPTLTCPASSEPYETLGEDGQPETNPECSLLAQDCPNPGEACEPVSVSGVYKAKCIIDDGLKGLMGACSTSAECQGGLYCVFGACSPVCCESTNEPCGGGTCNVLYSGDGNGYGPDKNIRLCSFLVQCELLTADACEVGTECHVQDVTTGLSLCVPPNGANVPEGGDCTYVNDCGNMQDCSAGKCRYHCRVSGSGSDELGLGGCPEGQACSDVDYGVPDVGICEPT